MNITQTEVPREGEPIAELVPQEKEAPAESSTETNQKVDEPSQGGDEQQAPNTPEEKTVPFNQHPRWREMESELSELRKLRQDYEQFKQYLPQYLDSYRVQLTNQDDTAPQWFVELYGDNPQAWKLYQEHENRRYEQVQQRVFQDFQNQQLAREQENARWVQWVNTEVARLQADGKQFDQNELMNTMLKYRPVDENGSLSFDKGYEILMATRAQQQIAANDAARKKIAAATASTPGDKSSKDYLNTADLRGKSWTSL